MLALTVEQVFHPYYRCLWTGSVLLQHRDIKKDVSRIMMPENAQEAAIPLHDRLVATNMSSWLGTSGAMVAQIVPATPSEGEGGATGSKVKVFGLREYPVLLLVALGVLTGL